METLIPLIPALPLAGFVVTAFVGRRLASRAWWLPVAAVVASWAVAMIVVFAALTGQTPFAADHGVAVKLWTWVPAGAFQVDFGFYVDQLTAVLLIVVTTIGMLVHIYSIGYMAHDPARWRFFAYLNLFMVSMLVLVLADNLLLVFVGWELVGLCSYLLIGFWYRRRSAALAAKKAFIVNRVGDVGFALGIMAVWANLHTLNFQQVFASIGSLPHGTIVLIAALLFCGAVGKSAQFPLHVWLPDAMEGPTPVSALIHAATMVNAGVYLVARANPIFGRAPEVMTVVAAIGVFTAILAASIAFTQTDIKRVLAYSTLSQLGYMFAGLGVGAWTAAIFHLMTHGFFKGLLFLDSGSVIHAVGDEQDMRRMGGLWRRIPVTYWTMLVGSVAISGIPPLAGFFSKDEILGGAFKSGFYWVWAVGWVVAGMTAFYMFRLMGMTFWGKSRVDPEVEPKIHESPRSMTVPLVLLAIPAALLGLAIGFPPESGLLHSWLRPVFEATIARSGRTEAAYTFFGIDGGLFILTVGLAAIAIVAAWRLFGVEIPALGLRHEPEPDRVDRLAAANGTSRFLYRASLNKWWFDDLYHLLFVVIGGRIAQLAWWFDRSVVDGAVNGVGSLTSGAGLRLRRVQTGHVQNYALGIALGLLLMAGSYLLITAR